MPSNRKDLASALSKPTAPPNLQRGRGLELSKDTETNTQGGVSQNIQEVEKTGKQENKKADTKPERRNLGYPIRTDLIQKTRRTALDEGRKAYQIVEEALEEYFNRREQK
jgi:hypothetical protein